MDTDPAATMTYDDWLKGLEELFNQPWAVREPFWIVHPDEARRLRAEMATEVRKYKK